jgi:hypothetical protein
MVQRVLMQSGFNDDSDDTDEDEDVNENEDIIFFPGPYFRFC